MTDTNRAFKAFESNALKSILYGIRIYTFPTRLNCFRRASVQVFIYQKQE